MAGESRQLIDELLGAADTMALNDLIERHLTKLDQDFEAQLWQLIEQLEEPQPETAARLREINRTVRGSVQTGNYRRAQLNEAEPENAKEVLLASARRVERGEAELLVAVEQVTDQLSRYSSGELYRAWEDLILSIERNPAMADYVALGELLYGAGRRLLLAPLFPLFGPAYNANQASARKLIEQNHYEEAIHVYERLIAIVEENNEPDLLCRALLSLGDLWRDRIAAATQPDHLERAERYHARALDVSKETVVTEEVRADARLQLGKTWVEQGRLHEGIEQIEQSLASCGEHGLSRSLVAYHCLIALVNAYFDARDYEAAGRHILAVFALARDPDAEAKVSPSDLINLAGMLGRVAQMIGDEAGGAISEAVKLASELGADPSAHKFRSSAYAALGIYCKQTGDLQGALDAYRDAIASAEACGNERAAARWMSDMRHIYLLLNRWNEAEEMNRRASEVYLRLRDYQGAANSLLDKGHLQLLLDKKPSLAAYSWAQAFVLFYRVGQPFGMGYAALNLNRVYQEEGDWGRAEACLWYCFSKAKEEGADRLKCYALGELAAIQAARQEISRAVETYGEAIALAEEAGELAEQDFRFRRGELLETLDQPGAAAEDYKRVIALHDAARGGLRATENRVLAQSRSEKSYARLIYLLARGQRTADEAFAASERARSRTLAELLSRRPLRPPASLLPELAQREQVLLEQLLHLEDSEELGLSLSQQYDHLARELKEVWREISEVDEVCREYADLRRAPVVDSAEVARLLIL